MSRRFPRGYYGQPSVNDRKRFVNIMSYKIHFMTATSYRHASAMFMKEMEEEDIKMVVNMRFKKHPAKV